MYYSPPETERDGSKARTNPNFRLYNILKFFSCFANNKVRNK